MKTNILTIFACVICLISPANAQRSDSIAAVVNDNVITYTNLYDRMDLVIKSSRMPNTKEFKSRLLPQVLTGLITEEIQIQEAARLGLVISDEEVEKGFAGLSAQNKLDPKQFKKILKKQKVAIYTLDKQIEAQLAWGKVIQREIRPRVALSDIDIENEVEHLKSIEGQEEFFIAEIFMPINEKAKESDVKKASFDLALQLSKDVKKFPAAARQFSQSSSSANGGIIGWVTPDNLDEEIGLKLKNMKVMHVSQPIKTDDGYTILFLRNKRIIDLSGGKTEEKLRIKMAVFTLPADEKSRKKIQSDIDEFRLEVKGCLDILKRTTKMKHAKLDEIYDVVSEIPSEIMQSIDGINIGDVGKNIIVGDMVSVPMLCGRDGGGSDDALKREIENRLGTQRMDVLQKRYLRDLISNAYIERRV